MHLDRQVFDARLHDLLVATIVELDGVGVSARFENDVIFLGQSFVCCKTVKATVLFRVIYENGNRERFNPAASTT
jgi:hypothetical protein